MLKITLNKDLEVVLCCFGMVSKTKLAKLATNKPFLHWSFFIPKLLENCFQIELLTELAGRQYWASFQMRKTLCTNSRKVEKSWQLRRKIFQKGLQWLCIFPHFKSISPLSKTIVNCKYTFYRSENRWSWTDITCSHMHYTCDIKTRSLDPGVDNMWKHCFQVLFILTGSFWEKDEMCFVDTESAWTIVECRTNRKSYKLQTVAW